jgi:hypothetical protein
MFQPGMKEIVIMNKVHSEKRGREREREREGERER